MGENHLGSTVDTKWLGKQLRVEYKNDNIEIVFGNRTLIIKKQDALEMLAEVVKWVARGYDSTKEALDYIQQDIIYTLDDQGLECSQTQRLQKAYELIEEVKGELKNGN
jgi:hypothetical protein